MLNYTVSKKIDEFEIKWKELFNNNPIFSPFQSYEWNNLMYNKYNFWLVKIINHLKSKEVLFYYFHEKSNKNQHVIAPLLIDHKNKIIQIFGNHEISDYLSFIFSKDISNDFLISIINYLRKFYKGYQIELDRINENNTKMLEIKANKLDIKYEVEIKKCVKFKSETNIIAKLNKDSNRYWNQAKNRIIKDCLVMHND